jgi:cell division protein FtsA
MPLLFGVTQADAERLKERYGCAYEPMVDPSDVIQLPSTVAQGDRQIPRELLAHIIHQRMDEIFDLVQRDISAAGFAGRLSAGVVLAGGASAMQGAAELASDVFGTGVRVGIPSENIGGLIDSVEAPRFATVTGLAQYGANRVALGSVSNARRIPMGGGMERIVAKIKFWLQDFF